MPPSFQVSKTSVRKSCLSKRRASALDEDEVRLLGGPAEDDAEAVTIEQPGRRREGGRMPGKPFAGGPRPRNTLHTSNILPDTRSTSTTTKRPASGFGKILRTQVSRGDNVEMSFSLKSQDTIPPPPSAKRQKIVHVGSSSSSAISIDDQFNLVPPDQIVLRPAHRTSGDSSQERAPGLLYRGNSRVGEVSEYSSLERMMKSHSSPTRQRKRNGSRLSQDDAPIPSQIVDAISGSNHIDMTMEDEVLEVGPGGRKKSTYQGTAKSAARRGAEGHLRWNNTDQVSPYFANAPSPKGHFPTPKQDSHTSPELLPRRQTEDTNLRDKFVQTDGLRRGGGQVRSSSPDELARVGNTIGKDSDSNAISLRHSESPNKDSSSLTFKSVDTHTGLDPSNIRATTWGSSRPLKQTRLAQEAEPPWSVRVSAVNLPGTESMLNDENLGLVYNEKSDCYEIQKSGHLLPAFSCRIEPKKLQKVVWETGGCRVRCESSRVGSEDTVAEFELSSAKALKDLLDRLQNGNRFKVVGKSSEYMNKMFERRRQEPRPARSYSGSALPSTTEIHWDPLEKDGRNAVSTLAPTNAPRASTKLVDELVNRALNTRGSTGSRSRPGTPLNATSPAAADGPRENGNPSKISKTLDRLMPTHNNHLRRSTRTSGASASYLDSSLGDIEEPPVEKYSKTHDLGPKWGKPLTYPKVGKKQTTVEWGDLERLDDGEFLNDNLVSFYLRFLEQSFEQDNPDLAKRIYFFNSFFYERLTTRQKGQKGINYAGVQKWTRSVDLFTYDYIIVPINEAAHWYLAIICNLPNLDRTLEISDEDSTFRSSAAKGQPDVSTRPKPEGSDDDVETDPTPFAEEPTEKETTESFAEMTLDNIAKELPAEANTSKDEDEVLLDAPMDEPPTVSKRREFVPRDADDLIEDPDGNSRSPTSSKKSKPKRKSFPPPVTHTDPQSPVIITFDSLAQDHNVVIRNLKQYFLAEGKDKRGGMEFDVSQIRGINAKKIPKQNNFSDCGPFMLGYVEKFLKDKPLEFVTKIIRWEYTDKDWSKLVPSNLRASIRDRIMDLHKIQRAEHKEKALKAGKYRGDASPSTSAALSERQEQKPDPVSKPSSKSASPIAKPATRADALKEARSIDDTDLASPTDRPLTTNAVHKRNVRYFPEAAQEESVILVDSQSQTLPALPSSQLTDALAEVKQNDIKLPASSMPSEIQDSQPDLEAEIATQEESAGTPPARTIKRAASSVEETTVPKSTRRKRGRPQTRNVDVGVKEADSVINID